MADSATQRTPHPRRTPAHKSVSLRHPDSAGQMRGKTPATNRANAPSTSYSRDSKASSLNPDSRKGSSGESSNADKWFEKSNSRVHLGASKAGEHEPPFYLRNSSSETPPDAAEARAAPKHAAKLTLPNLNTHSLGQTASGLEDFRGIIDDLTVQNKKLKRRLRKYEKLYDAHLQQEKLFEIRVHGLPGSKKQELEDMLRKFATSLGQDPSRDVATESAGSPSTLALLPHPTVPSSRTSTRFADSAYISNSALSQNPPLTAPGPGRGKLSKSSVAQRREDIHSYLHDIPAGLLPRQPVAMTEKAKQKLVVRRLEQIFAGKGAAVGGHQHPLQQQEVSQSAAYADRMAIEAAGQVPKAEGLREARIFRNASNEDYLAVAPPAESQGTSPSGNSTEQRPTRPLDLDLHRAQVPQDNIEYIRHLGFSQADLHNYRRYDESHGWVYLNVLTNMAQLHTLNVTNDFITKSISEYSDKLELSYDARKVRWKGGHDVTSTSSDASPGRGILHVSPSSKGKTVMTKSDAGGCLNGISAEAQSKASKKLAYVPLFVHKQSPDGDETSEDTPPWESPPRDQVTGNSSGFTGSGMRTAASKWRQDNDGPIIFYNRARFCTDLSGDRGEQTFSSQAAIKYSVISETPVGAQPAPESDVSYDRRPAVRGCVAEDPMDIDKDLKSPGTELVGFCLETIDSDGSEGLSSPVPLDFEVSGLGGVQPGDNFQITVRSNYPVTAGRTAAAATHFANKTQLSNIFGAARRSCCSSQNGPLATPVEDRVVDVRRKELGPSCLPEPASLFNFSSLEDNDADSEGESGAESDVSSIGDDDGPPPSTVPQLLHFSSTPMDEDAQDDSGDDKEDGGSVDLLALARELDPVAVHEREREYNANMAERMGEEIPAGSSAATAGGGSGYSSPVEGDAGALRKVKSGDQAFA